MAKYLNNWSDFDGMISDFSNYNYITQKSDPPDTDGVEVLLASYGTPSCEGYAFVLFRKDGQLYEVNGSHCSCYGLEGQWQPEATTIESLRHRIENGNLGQGGYDQNPFRAELVAVLDEISA